MPVCIKKSSLGTMFLYKCEHVGCDAPAVFGTGVDFRAAMNRLAKNDKINTKKLLGEWWCIEHLPRPLPLKPVVLGMVSGT